MLSSEIWTWAARASTASSASANTRVALTAGAVEPVRSIMQSEAKNDVLIIVAILL
ncbi:MAG TPA: hypothetical protein VH481_08920 [Nitrososphaeraceae archaeon]